MDAEGRMTQEAKIESNQGGFSQYKIAELNQSFLKLSFCLLFLLLSGCSDQSLDSIQQQSRVERIRFGLTTDPVTLDPRFATDAVSDRINRLLYARLVDFDENYRVVSSLASWQKINPKHYRFRLRNNHRNFHDGSKLTSKDVQASYLSVLDSAVASPHRGSLKMIESIQTPDAKTIDFYLNKADALFVGRLTLGILPAHLLAKDYAFNNAPVGSGPMRLIAWPQSGELLLERLFDQQQIEFITVKDPTVRVLKLLRGELDLFQNDIPQEMLPWLEKQQDVVIAQTKGSTFSYLGFNLQDPIVGQLAVRQAIAYAIDKKSIIDFVFRQTARSADTLFVPEHWASYAAAKGYEQNQSKARKLLTRLGFDQKKPLKIVYKTSNNPFRIRLATVIQDQLKQVGIELQIKSYDWGTFYGDIKSGHFQMYSLSWVGLKLPDIFRYVFHSESIPPDGANRGRYSDPQSDRLIEAAEVESDLVEMTIKYQQLQVRLLEQLPYIPLWYEDNILIRRHEVKGYQLASDGNYDALKTAYKE